ncbi:MAG: tetratricopeptide repeat protein [Chitinophagales bacterium]
MSNSIHDSKKSTSSILQEKKNHLLQLLNVVQSEISSDPQTAYVSIQQAFSLAKELKDQESLATLYRQRAKYFQLIGNYVNTAKDLEKAKSIYEQLNNQEGIVDSVNSFAVLEYFKGNFQEALSFIEDALRLSKKIHHEQGIGNSFNLLGSILKEQGKYDEALKYFFEGLEIVEKFETPELAGHFYNNIGIIYSIQGNRQKALHFLHKGLEKRKEYGSKLHIAGSLTNIGSVYAHLKDYNRALQYFQQVLDIYQSLVPESEQEALGLTNMSMIYSKTNEFEKALEYSHKALVIRQKLGVKTNEIFTLNNLAILYIDMGRYEEALKYVIESEKFAIEKELNSSLVMIYQIFTQCYEGLKEFEKAVIYYKKLLEVKDQQYNEDKANSIAKLQVTYETAQKEKEIELQKLALEKKELALERKRDVEKMNVQLEKMVEQRTQELSIQNKQLKQYAYIVAHDLKEPLCNLSGVARLLNESYRHQLEPVAQNFLAHIEQSTTYMNRLLEDLLVYAMLNKEVLLSIEVTSMNEAMQEVEEILSEKIKMSEAKIILGNMPQKLKIAKRHLVLLLQNILSNALQFNRKNVATLIRITKTIGNHYYRFEIKDNGIGIEPENQQKIFNIFHRLDKENYEGTGIGLAICEKIVQLYGGEIGVKSTINQGSTFYFTLPR